MIDRLPSSEHGGQNRILSIKTTSKPISMEAQIDREEVDRKVENLMLHVAGRAQSEPFHSTLSLISRIFELLLLSMCVCVCAHKILAAIENHQSSSHQKRSDSSITDSTVLLRQPAAATWSNSQDKTKLVATMQSVAGAAWEQIWVALLRWPHGCPRGARR